jgi:flagellar basal-body rod modification protein FlgD
MQAAALVGHDVMAPGSAMQLAAGHARGGVDLPQAVDRLRVTITDSSGAVVHSADLGAQPQGIVQITWDGITDTGATAADGKYQFAVTATAQGQAATTQTLMVGHVQGITAGTDGTNLDLGTLGNVSLAHVKRFL